jgi:hypothetical protein
MHLCMCVHMYVCMYLVCMSGSWEGVCVYTYAYTGQQLLNFRIHAHQVSFIMYESSLYEMHKFRALHLQCTSFRPHKVLCVWFGRTENKPKQIPSQLTFAFSIKFSYSTLLWTRKSDRVRFLPGKLKRKALYVKFVHTCANMCFNWLIRAWTSCIFPAYIYMCTLIRLFSQKQGVTCREYTHK